MLIITAAERLESPCRRSWLGVNYVEVYNFGGSLTDVIHLSNPHHLINQTIDRMFRTSYMHFNACSISAIMSSAFSIPMDNLIRSGAIPTSLSCSSVN